MQEIIDRRADRDRMFGARPCRARPDDGRLGFDGSMMEAMGNMGPFENFLLLVGKVPSEAGSCPAK